MVKRTVFTGRFEKPGVTPVDYNKIKLPIYGGGRFQESIISFCAIPADMPESALVGQK